MSMGIVFFIHMVKLWIWLAFKLPCCTTSPYWHTVSFLTLAFCSLVPPAGLSSKPACDVLLGLGLPLSRLTSTTNCQSSCATVWVLSFSSPSRFVLLPLWFLFVCMSHAGLCPSSWWLWGAVSDWGALLDVSLRVPFAGERGSSFQVSLRAWSEDGDQTARRWCLWGEGCSADEEVWTEHFCHLGCASLWDAGRNPQGCRCCTFLFPVPLELLVVSVCSWALS